MWRTYNTGGFKREVVRLVGVKGRSVPELPAELVVERATSNRGIKDFRDQRVYFQIT
ncbi:hypothetical protein PsAD13_05171 [Pseudovibrio sp. Ad13]|uniref:hypothetical protein n=1 Tax=Pseudovibrio sp. Ad13 TaxID=989396 RepID=UPI0007B2775B|nr:hypothetical protein [Pseudovibrio sp. Ad13]KZK79055.1 hypothetical protein PsAD13_05171 [Pseudovibrio sp. Ad13]